LEEAHIAEGRKVLAQNLPKSTREKVVKISRSSHPHNLL
jgi:hypothetical protein